MPPLSAGARRGALAIVLHTHMPYVEGFGTWPFGEEWLWEAMIGSYLPLLELLDRGVPLTLSLTPVLCDQLEAPGVAARLEAFVREVRAHTYREDARGLRAGGHERLAAELERAYGEYEHALACFQERGGELLAALAPHAQWTSAATHAVLPLLATDGGVRAQVRCGVDAHRARFGETWRGGFWLPECAHAPHLEGPLLDAGARAACLELTGQLGLGAAEHLRPLISDSGLTLVPIDRATISLVWSPQGYPSQGAYRDSHRRTIHHHNPWANDGGAYDHERALAQAARDAADFVERVGTRLREGGEALGGEALVVCALDTELLGHWWYEGVAWLSAVAQECARQGVELVRLDEALERCEPLAMGELCASSPALRAHVREERPSTWGEGGDLRTWSAPAVGEVAFDARAAELQMLRAGPCVGAAALRELLALQASDWAFMLYRGIASPYARDRLEGHRAGLERALAEGPAAATGELRNLAVHAAPASLAGL